LREVSKKELTPKVVDLVSLREGRSLVLNAGIIQAIFNIIKDAGLEGLAEVYTDEQLVQLRYQSRGLIYLATFNLQDDNLILKPLRTIGVLGLDNGVTAALRKVGLAVEVVAEEKENKFREKVQALLTRALDFRLARFIALDKVSLVSLLGPQEFTKMSDAIIQITGNSIQSPDDFLPSGDLDFDSVMQKFQPSWDKQVRTLAPGHGLCPGCGQATDIKQTIEVIQGHKLGVVGVIATGCLEVSSTNWPFNAWRIPMVHGNYTAQATIIAGILRGYQWYRQMGYDPYQGRIIPLVIMGDGGFAIGLNNTAGALVKPDLPISYLIENNAATQNTGAQPIAFGIIRNDRSRSGGFE